MKKIYIGEIGQYVTPNTIALYIVHACCGSVTFFCTLFVHLGTCGGIFVLVLGVLGAVLDLGFISPPPHSVLELKI